jgi:hypothetical protein
MMLQSQEIKKSPKLTRSWGIFRGYKSNPSINFIAAAKPHQAMFLRLF